MADLVLGPGQDGKTIQPEGLKASGMTEKQRAMLVDLIAEWAGIVHESAAAARMAQLKADLNDTWFSWSGPTTVDPGKNIGAYYRIQGPHLVIEYAPQGMGGDPSHARAHDVPRPDQRLRQARNEMKVRLACVVAILLPLGTTAHAHRLDEYLEATILSLDGNRIHAEIRLTPGVSIAPVVIGEIDTNRDGVISAAEQHSYAAEVLADLSLAVDGNPIRPHLVSLRFPRTNDMKEGTGEIELDFDAALPPRGGSRRLTFENRHEFPIAAYLVNCLVPQDHVSASCRRAATTRNRPTGLILSTAALPPVRALSPGYGSRASPRGQLPFFFLRELPCSGDAAPVQFGADS